jgi:hypothetical protein
MRRGFFGDEDVGALVLFVGGEDLLFVVAALGVDFPRVEFGMAEEAEGGVVAGAPDAENRTSDLENNAWLTSGCKDRRGPRRIRRS